MKALSSKVASLRENFVAELADAALEEASRHGVRGTSIEQELGYWKALVPVVSGCVEEMRTGTSVECNSGNPEDFLARLAEAAYEVSLEHGFRDSFLDPSRSRIHHSADEHDAARTVVANQEEERMIGAKDQLLLGDRCRL